MFACWQVFFHSKPQVHTKRSTLKSETSVPNVSKPPFPPPFFLWMCYFVNVQVKKTHRGQVINTGCNLRVLLEPKPLSLPLYKWVKDNWRALQLQIALTQGSSLRCRCNDNYEKKKLIFWRIIFQADHSEQSRHSIDCYFFLLHVPRPPERWSPIPASARLLLDVFILKSPLSLRFGTGNKV